MDKQITYNAIIETVQRLTQAKRTDRIYPHELLGWLPFTCSVWTVRRYMVQMSEQQKLERVSRRGGYRLPSPALPMAA